ncbi:MAG: heme-binding protein, partial [Planctomycetota bacterium]|nr:heme-binding protein [Planctomycetota bacterium]
SSSPTENVAGWTSIAGETADETTTLASFNDPSETTPDVGAGANSALVTTADSVGAGDSTSGDLQVTLTSGLAETATETTSRAKTGVESSSAAANSGDSASSATGATAGTSTFGSADTGATNAGDTVGQDGSTISNNSLSGGASATGNSPATIDADTLRALGLQLDENGNAIGTADTALPGETSVPWWQGVDEPVVVKFDFRDQGDFKNLITADERARAIDALNAWSDASGGKVIFERDQSAPDAHIINIGTGDMRAFGYASSSGGTLAVGGGRLTQDSDGKLQVTGATWLDVAENWDTQVGNGDPAGTYDYFTVVAHELGHTLGYDDARQKTSDNMMTGVYDRERSAASVKYAVDHGTLYRGIEDGSVESSFNVLPMTTADVQLTASEVKQLLERAAAASASSDGIFAVVDRNGRILGVRCEQQVLNNFAGNTAGLVFAIDGAIAKARTAAFFANGDAQSSPSLGPLTSRVIQFISQSTVTQREVEGNPNADNSSAASAAAASTTRGPGFVAPIGVGGHFPPGVADTPPVDLFAIEHTNRDSNLAPGADGVKGTADDIALRTITDGLGRIRNRFNMDPTYVPTGQALFAPESYGNVQNSNLLPDATSRGIATLPGGIPIYKDTNSDGRGDTVVGGIGVFFPGKDGYATYEQGFVPGIGQTQEQRLNAPKVLEAEYIAYAAIGGSFTAEQDCGVAGARIGTLDGVAPVAGIDLPFGRIDLVGITLALIGPTAGLQGLQDTIAYGNTLGTGNKNDGADQPLTGGVDGKYREGEVVPEGWLVMPHSSTVNPALTAADVTQIITQGINAANAVRAAIRLPIGSRTRMVFAVTDTSGEVLGLYRMPDATVFSIDVAVAKARNTAYYADATDLQPVDQVAAPGVAFSNRTFRFLAEPRYPSGVEGSRPPAFSILLDPGTVTQTAENAGAPTPAGQFNSVLGHDAFNIMTNFRDPGDPSVVAAGGVSAPTANQNGIVFFPGSTSIYKNGQLVGGLGVSGDGVDQDDVVTYCAAQDYLPTGTVLRADQVFVDGVRLPYIKFLRNPFG